MVPTTPAGVSRRGGLCSTIEHFLLQTALRPLFPPPGAAGFALRENKFQHVSESFYDLGPEVASESRRGPGSGGQVWSVSMDKRVVTADLKAVTYGKGTRGGRNAHVVVYGLCGGGAVGTMS